jgi:lipid II:glycine glycyltransferase (peptidoglycan interpeptide bridge formation enzyme)
VACLMISTKQIDNKSEWEGFLSQHKEANFLQSWYWGEFHEALGKTVSRIGFYRDNELIGVMLSVIEAARRGKYLTVPAGPIIDWHDKELVSAAFSEMRTVAAVNKCVFVRIRPQLLEDAYAKEIFQLNNTKPAQMHLHAELTSRLDIGPTEEALLAQMRKTTRYEIRKAEKLGVTVKTSTDEKEVKQFYDYQLETAKRQKFVPFSYKFFLEQFKVFFAADKALLYTATFEGKVLAQAFIIFYGSEAVYHYGVGTEEGRKYPGAYLIQWEAIKEAKRRGMQFYNFWGVAAEDDKTHRFYTISIFKRGFGGEDTRYLHAQDLVINKPRYLVNYGIEKLRKIVRRV